MKNLLFAHPMFKPFADLTEEECVGILLGLKHNWSLHTKLKDGVRVTVEDHTEYNSLYNEVFKYFALNWRYLYKECGFPHENYGEAFEKLIAMRLIDLNPNYNSGK